MEEFIISDLRKEFIKQVKAERGLNIPKIYNVQRHPDYVDWLELKVTKQCCQCEECQKGYLHRSDCAVHNEPAEPKGACNCF